MAKKDEKQEEVKVTPAMVRKLVAKAFNLPVAGITISKDYGNKPIVNSIGLQSARLNYPDVIVVETMGFEKKYEKVGDMAVAFVTGTHQFEKTADKITEVGTASAANMNTIRDYPNELALTRAFNRFLRRTLFAHLYKTYEENVSKMTPEEQKILEENAGDFGAVSAEELTTTVSEELPTETFLTNEDMANIKELLARLVAVKTQEELDAIRKDIETQKEAGALNEKQLKKLREAYSNARESNGLL